MPFTETTPANGANIPLLGLGTWDIRGDVCTRIVRQDSGLWQEVEVTPAVDFSRLDAVLVLTEGARRAAVAAESEDDDVEPAEER